MYERYYQFHRKPFELVPTPEFLYLSRTHKRALTYFDYGLRERVGFILLTGEAGVGKTTLIREFIKKHADNVTLSMVFNTKVSATQLLAMINEDFGLESAGKDKVLLLKELNQFLIDEYEQGRQSVLIIDEAHNLTPELLEEVRMLSNLETDEAKLLLLILSGQPELGRLISMAELRQLRQRISIVCQLYPLMRRETEEYVYHRLTVAGNKDAVSIPREAFDILHECSNGIPRVINKICDFLLLTAFTEETREVTIEMIRDIAEDLEADMAERHSPESDDLEHRRHALLSALSGQAPQRQDVPLAQAVTQPAHEGGYREDPLFQKDLKLRVGAMEKELSRICSICLPELSSRVDHLERKDLPDDHAQHTQAVADGAPDGSTVIPPPEESPAKCEEAKAKRWSFKNIIRAEKENTTAKERTATS